ncbi:bZIP transcription factor 44-like [Camellia sinensis]|uniref:bZIP transcription factor 44-like n=1 Tax=Camellia sinensis TaxID=4442 RepID=UPI001036A1E0|nr:bZIP transcription factor 44-like [Camellia sinensis]
MMASPSGVSSGSSHLLHSSSSEGDPKQGMDDQRKRKRMISNRESARRSWMRKQKHLDELVAQASRLRDENGYVMTNVNLTSQMWANFEAENSVLRAQVDELTHRLSSLNEIIDCLSSKNDINGGFDGIGGGGGDDFLNPWNLMYVNQPIMASAADMFTF